jgi:major type 1 subunit fimbrin (pilin)
MKKLILSAALTASFGLVALQASAADGVITFTGEVTDVTCSLSGGGAATGTGDLTVALPTVGAGSLSADGQTVGDTNFSLVLGGDESCSNGKTAAMWIESSATPALDAATGALKNQQADGAENVQVRLINPANSQPINLAVNADVVNGASVVASSNQPAASISGNTATLNYTAQYLASGGAATAGQVSTYLTYSMQYN